ncbi:hypothetical protein [Vibrio parahaemolyticus]|uniref:hypothetical protein n=1 Tax=Vibrio parahaemolyticus TaxID=670 RepID=UPI001110BD2F|nr:hypothetical protein [Vibrio parahaemolyticus]TMX40183.1 hypothetical protein DA098_05250 [Vibrio parahaemolyticus]TMX78455.1 hypothetical protein DA094_10150 [Vibrio parahaemolyticus]
MDMAQKLREQMQEERTKDLSSMREQFGKDALLVPNKEQEKKKQKKKIKPEDSNAKIYKKEFRSKLLNNVPAEYWDLMKDLKTLYAEIKELDPEEKCPAMERIFIEAFCFDIQIHLKTAQSKLNYLKNNT